MDERERWDARHAERAGREEEPDAFVAAVLARLGPGAGRRALDLASGAGRHALALAERGWETWAWDRSEVAGRLLAEGAARRGVRVGWRALDLERDGFPAGEPPFDLVVLVNYLDRALLARVDALLRPGGHLVFTTFTTEREGEHPRAERCLAPGELARGLAGFETLELREAGGRAGLLARRPPVDVRAFEPALWDDFLRLHDEQNGFGWCRCVAWWTPTWDEFRARSAEQNLAHRRALAAAGAWDGFLAYERARPVGWCQVGERDRLAKLTAQYALPPSPGTCAITCVAVAPDRRRRGVARALLAGALRELERRGFERVEAFPRRCGPAPTAGELWTGPEGLFRELGFEVQRQDPERPVLARTLRGLP